MLSVSVSKLSSHEQQGRGPERAARKHEHGPRQDLFTRIPTGGKGAAQARGQQTGEAVAGPAAGVPPSARASLGLPERGALGGKPLV